jgi:hypothetical protein
MGYRYPAVVRRRDSGVDMIPSGHYQMSTLHSHRISWLSTEANIDKVQGCVKWRTIYFNLCWLLLLMKGVVYVTIIEYMGNKGLTTSFNYNSSRRIWA